MCSWQGQAGQDGHCSVLRVVEWSSGQGGWSVHDCHGGLGGPDAYCGPYGLGDKASQGGPGGQVVRWSDGQVVRWSGGQVVRWSGGHETISTEYSIKLPQEVWRFIL